MKMLKDEKGFIKVVFVILLLIFSGYVGIQFGIPYYRYSAFKSDTKELARISLGQVERTKTQVFEKAQEFKIPISQEDINVMKTEQTVIVRTNWSETVDILGLYQKRLDFDINIEE